MNMPWNSRERPVALQHLLDLARHSVVLVADHEGRHHARSAMSLPNSS
jgi:hypothetical protein